MCGRESCFTTVYPVLHAGQILIWYVIRPVSPVYIIILCLHPVSNIFITFQTTAEAQPRQVLQGRLCLTGQVLTQRLAEILLKLRWQRACLVLPEGIQAARVRVPAASLSVTQVWQSTKLYQRIHRVHADKSITLYQLSLLNWHLIWGFMFEKLHYQPGWVCNI